MKFNLLGKKYFIHSKLAYTLNVSLKQLIMFIETEII